MDEHEYKKALIKHIELWRSTEETLSRIDFIGITGPLAFAMMAFIFYIMFLVFDGDSGYQVGFLGASWRFFSLIGASIAAYFALFMFRPCGLIISWLQFLAFYAVVGMTYAFLITTLVNVEYDVLSNRERYEFDRNADLLLMATVAAIFMIASVEPLTHHIRLRTDQIDNGSVVHIEMNDESIVWQCIAEAISKTNSSMSATFEWELKPEMIALYLARSSGSSPYLYLDGWIHLIVPRDFVVLCSRDPSTASTILVHEFAHVFHGDTEIGEKQSVLQRSFWTRLLPLSLINVIGLFASIFQFVEQSNSAIAPASNMDFDLPHLVFVLAVLSLPVLLIRARSKVKKSRLSSEAMADAVAGMAYGYPAISDAIDRYVPSGDEKSYRLDRLI